MTTRPSWKLAKQIAVRRLHEQGLLSDEELERGPTLQKTCRLLNLRTTEGALIRGQRFLRQAIIKWFETGNNIVLVDYVPAAQRNRPETPVAQLKRAARRVHGNNRDADKWRHILAPSFYRSTQWLELRFHTLKAACGKCSLCGRSAGDNLTLHVDHIKPRSLYPWLALDPKNLQVLCSECNVGKRNLDETKWSNEPHVDR